MLQIERQLAEYLPLFSPLIKIILEYNDYVIYTNELISLKQLKLASFCLDKRNDSLHFTFPIQKKEEFKKDMQWK